MGRARVVAPPPKDYVPEPLVAPPIEVDLEETIIQEWSDSNLIEQLEEVTTQEVSQDHWVEEQEKERIAQEKYEELQRQKAAVEAEAKTHAKLKRKAKKDPELLAEMEALRSANQELAKRAEAAERAREEQILKMRQQATEQRGNQLNIVKQRKPSIWSRVKAFFRRRRIELATVAKSNYEVAIIQRARVAVPKMLDDIERMHEQLTILEELIAKYVERQKIKDQ